MEYSTIGDYLTSVRNFGRDIYKSGTKGLATLVLGGALAFGGFGLGACREDVNITPPPGTEEQVSQNYSLRNFQENLVNGGYERPGGIAKEVVYSTKEVVYSSSGNVLDMPEISGVYFVGRPIYGSGTFLLPPTIYNYNSEGIPSTVFNNFTDLDLGDFSSAAGNNIDYNGQNGIRPNGLYINLVQLDDGSIVVSSNMSITSDSEGNEISRLFRIFNNGTVLEKEVWMSNNELYGITHMIKGSDGKIYAAQVHLTRPNRVISINPNTKSINPEFEIPGEQSSVFSKRGVPTDAQLKIAENSLEGKVANGVDFYVSDLMNNIIYKVSKGVVTPLASIRKPTSMVVDYSGNLFVTTAPYLNMDASSLGIKTELLKVSPTNGTSELLYNTFNEDISDYNTAGGITVDFNGQTYLFTTGFEISSLLHENLTTWNMLFINSHSGKLNVLTAIKDYAPTITFSEPVEGSSYPQTSAPIQITTNITDTEGNLNKCWYSTDSGTTKTPFLCVLGDNVIPNLTPSVGSNVWKVGANNLFSDGTTGNEVERAVNFTITQP